MNMIRKEKKMKIVFKNSMKKREVEAEGENKENPSKRMKIVIKKKGLRMIFSALYLPKRQPLKPLGEDAHFIAAEEQTIGVADGVGGWAKHGIDSGEYARELMKNSVTSIQGEAKDGSAHVNPKRVLQEAFSKTKLPGASTACILTHNDGVLRAANVGDSGFMVFRDRKLYYTSPTQQHRFNHPYQLGIKKRCDRPDCAEEIELEGMKEGDLIVMGTDGLFDNMYPSEIEEIVERFGKKKEGKLVLEALAWKIALAAYMHSLNKFYVSPFEIANTMAGKKHKGGKKDDITVIVGKITRHYDFQLHT